MKIIESILLVIGIIILITLKIKSNNKDGDLYKLFSCLFTLLLIHTSSLLILASSLIDIEAIYIDNITYISTVYLPVVFLFISLKYTNEKVNIKKYKYLFIIPTISLLTVFTNKFHKLFYLYYSININEVILGPFLYIHTVYSYILLLYSFIILIRGAIKKSGFLSPQTGLIVLGALAPVIPNVLGTLKIISISIYVTPMMFTITAICFYIAIIKLKALNIIPVTFRTIIDTMSDSFVVVSDDGTISDLNKTFINTFKPIADVKDKDNFFDLIESTGIADLNKIKKDIAETREKDMLITKEYHLQKGDFDRYLEIDCQPIKAKSGNEYIATLILIRDITTQKRDMEIMTKNENLVILGELAGGVAHDINTPISAIKSGLLMFNDLVKTDDQKMLLKNMNSCVDKITNLVNSLRNQIRNIGSDEKIKISIKSIVDDIYVILHNELNKNNIELKVDIKEDIFLIGNSTKLSQVITNIIMNAIQAYEGKQGDIKLSVYTSDKNEAIIRVEDHAGGIPESVSPYIFKNILTTKGVSGTGFGLYLAYSVIKGAFGGEILFDTKIGEGTVFYIVIPLNI